MESILHALQAEQDGGLGGPTHIVKCQPLLGYDPMRGVTDEGIEILLLHHGQVVFASNPLS